MPHEFLDIKKDSPVKTSAPSRIPVMASAGKDGNNSFHSGTSLLQPPSIPSSDAYSSPVSSSSMTPMLIKAIKSECEQLNTLAALSASARERENDETRSDLKLSNIEFQNNAKSEYKNIESTDTLPKRAQNSTTLDEVSPISNTREMNIVKWLASLGMSKYGNNFIENGFDSIAVISEMETADLSDIKVEKSDINNIFVPAIAKLYSFLKTNRHTGDNPATYENDLSADYDSGVAEVSLEKALFLTDDSSEKTLTFKDVVEDFEASLMKAKRSFDLQLKKMEKRYKLQIKQTTSSLHQQLQKQRKAASETLLKHVKKNHAAIIQANKSEAQAIAMLRTETKRHKETLERYIVKSGKVADSLREENSKLKKEKENLSSHKQKAIVKQSSKKTTSMSSDDNKAKKQTISGDNTENKKTEVIKLTSKEKNIIKIKPEKILTTKVVKDISKPTTKVEIASTITKVQPTVKPTTKVEIASTITKNQPRASESKQVTKSKVTLASENISKLNTPKPIKLLSHEIDSLKIVPEKI